MLRIPRTRQPRVWIALASTLILALHVPFLLMLAGDAQVHLAFAEAFAAGRPFQYNPGDALVMASSSPFWTLLLAAAFRLVGPWTALVVKLAAVAGWGAASYLLYRAARGVWAWPRWQWLLLMALWLSSTALIANALGGLENVLSAAQLLLLYLGCVRGVRRLTWPLSFALGLLLGWMLLTRMDAGVFGLVLLAVFAAVKWFQSAGRHRGALAARLLLVVGLGLLVVAPWYIYQMQHTGRLLSDSALARFYLGRRGSIMLIQGGLYLHTKAVVTLVTLYLPLAAGAAVYAAAAARALWRARGTLAAHLPAAFPALGALAVTGAGVAFYTFVVGAEHFGRYLLPIFPFFFLLGLAGWWQLLEGGRRWSPRLTRLGLVAAVVFLLAVSGVDFARRVFLGDQYANNLAATLLAPAQRQAYTTEFLESLGRLPNSTARVAVTEVQLRYFVDERVNVLSLDGRTSADALRVLDPVTLMPDFKFLFLQQRPDFVELGTWCQAGGWEKWLIRQPLPDNLLCQFERQAAGLPTGRSFDWDGRPVTLVGVSAAGAPHWVQINWGDH
ncbi:MAG: hypothetical protein ABI847_16280 [Anaerolineales bacterium]